MTEPDQDAGDLHQLLDDASGPLACGADIDDLLEQAADGTAGELTAHQQGCPHCRAALREFRRIWAPVRRLAAEPVSFPAALKAAVSSQIRKLTADIWYTLELAEGGAIRIGARVVATIARDAARRVPGVRVVFGRSTRSPIAAIAEKATLGHRHPHAAVGVLGRTAIVDLAAAVEYGLELDAVAREMQQRVIDELRSKAGLQDVVVNVTIDDVITNP